MGLSGTLGSLLGFLNIAELGIGAAIGYVLYKPIAESDELKIKEIVSVLGYLYRCIGHIILFLGFLLSLALPFIFKNEPFTSGVIFIGFYAYLFSSLIGYYNNYKQVLLSADQREYEVKGYYQIIISIMTLVQMVFALYTGNFYIFFLLQLLGGIIYSFVLNYRINRVYPWLKTEIKRGKTLLKQYPEITKYIKQIFVHKVGGFIQFELSPFLIYSFVSLPMVAIYANYTLLTDKLSKLIQGVLDSTSAGVGNLISEGDSEKIWRVYQQLFSLRMFIAGLCSSSFYYLSDGFICLWLGNDYLLPNTTILLLTISFFLLIVRGTTDQFLNGYGLFYDVWAPIAEAIIFLVSSVLFGKLMGLNGILLGPILSMLFIIHFWKPYFLFRKGLNRSIGHYIKQFLFCIGSSLLSYALSSWLISLFEITISSWGVLLFKSCLFLILYLCIQFILYYSVLLNFRLISKQVVLRVVKFGF